MAFERIGNPETFKLNTVNPEDRFAVQAAVWKTNLRWLMVARPRNQDSRCIPGTVQAQSDWHLLGQVPLCKTVTLRSVIRGISL